MNNLLKFGSVGVMDSGIGGLTILNAISASYPKLNLIYYGDNKNAPYGNKPLRELKRLAINGVEHLVENGAKLIVVACNTLSTNLIEYIKAVSPVPVVPTLPINEINESKYAVPTLIATPNTINSNYVKTEFKNFSLVPLPFLAGEIERFIFSPQKISLEKDLTALPDNADYLYLGCTHYIFLKPKIEEILNIKVCDNAHSVCELVKEALTKTNVKDMKGKAYINFVGDSRNYNYQVFKSVLYKRNSHKFIHTP